MSGGLPPNVSYFMQRLLGVSTSHFKIFPQNSGSQSANKIIRFELPSNTLLNLKSCRMLFNVTTTATGAVTQARLPNDTRSFIDRMAIYMGGVLVQNSFSNYNVLVHAKKALGADRLSETVLTHPEICRTTSYHDGTIFNAGGTKDENIHESYSTLDKQLAICDWEGFLGTASPGIIDTGLFPQITIEITLADNVILPQCTWAASTPLALATATTNASTFVTTYAGGIAATGAGTASYTMDNITLQVEVLGMASSVLDEVVAQRISQVGYLSIPFKNYFSFSSSHSATSRFNVNSASWDRLWVAWRDANGGAVSAPVPVSGYKVAAGLSPDVGKPLYDIGGVLDTNKEKYVARAFNFVEPIATGAISNYQLQINSANYPAYKLTVPEVYTLTMNSIDIYDKTRVMSLDQYRDNYFVQCYRFCLNESDYGRLASGLDTRATSAQCALVTENVNNSTPCFIFAECQSELRVANRSIEVIV